MTKASRQGWNRVGGLKFSSTQVDGFAAEPGGTKHRCHHSRREATLEVLLPTLPGPRAEEKVPSLQACRWQIPMAPSPSPSATGLYIPLTLHFAIIHRGELERELEEKRFKALEARETQRKAACSSVHLSALLSLILSRKPFKCIGVLGTRSRDLLQELATSRVRRPRQADPHESGLRRGKVGKWRCREYEFIFVFGRRFV